MLGILLGLLLFVFLLFMGIIAVPVVAIGKVLIHEHQEDKRNKIRTPLKRLSCNNCGTENQKDAKFCKKCGNKLGIPNPSSEGIPSGETQAEKVSNWWWLLPILLTIIGGFIAWFVNKDKNPKKARRMLILGFIVIILILSMRLPFF